jgi:hypothetical protein
MREDVEHLTRFDVGISSAGITEFAAGGLSIRSGSQEYGGG